MPRYREVHQIQSKVLDILRKKSCPDHVLSTQTYSLSAVPDPEFDWIPTVRRDGVIVVFVCDRELFNKFVKECNKAGLWVSYRFEGYGVDKFTYSCFVSEMD